MSKSAGGHWCGWMRRCFAGSRLCRRCYRRNSYLGSLVPTQKYMKKGLMGEGKIILVCLDVFTDGSLELPI